jgi:2-dehydropantoate 2-reductase
MNALGVHVTDLPGTPVRLLAWLLNALPLRLSQPLLRQALGKGRGAKMPSFHIDLHSGRKQSEVEYLNGAVARFGAQVGIATPVNDFLTRTLTALSAGDLPLDWYKHNPEKFLSEIPTK